LKVITNEMILKVVNDAVTTVPGCLVVEMQKFFTLQLSIFIRIVLLEKTLNAAISGRNRFIGGSSNKESCAFGSHNS
jgi:hypothetical protein